MSALLIAVIGGVIGSVVALVIVVIIDLMIWQIGRIFGKKWTFMDVFARSFGVR